MSGNVWSLKTMRSGSSSILSVSNAVCDFRTINKNNSKQRFFIVTAPSTGGTISAEKISAYLKK